MYLWGNGENKERVFAMFLKKMVCFLTSALFCLTFGYLCFAAPWIDMNITYDGGTHRYSAESVYLYINGSRIENLSMPPIIFSGSTVVPAREVFEPLGAVVDWKKESEEVLIAYNDNIISIGMGKSFANVNGKEFALAVPAKIINNKAMIPARFIAEALGLEVTWDAGSRIIGISEVIKEETTTETTTQDSAESTETTTVFVYGGDDSGEYSDTGKKAAFSDVECEDGVLTVKADGLLGDFSMLESSNKKICAFDVSRAKLDIDYEYSFDDKYIKKASFMPVKNNGRNFVRVIVELNDETAYNAYMTDGGKSFVVAAGENIRTNENQNGSSSGSDSIISSDYDGNVKVLSLGQNINWQKDTLVLKKAESFNINGVSHEDNYSKRKYAVSLGCDLSDYISSGRYNIGTEAVDYVEVVNGTGGTSIIFSEKKILAYDVSADEKFIYIKHISPKKKYPKIVIVDAGHGDGDPGASANGLVEKDLTLDIARRIVNLIEKDGSVKAYAIRLDDTFYTRPERSEIANESGDLFVSIHMNSFDAARANGTEVWFYPHSNDNSIGFTSKAFADILQKNLTAALGSTDRGVKSYDYDVLTMTNIPAALCEVGFITNPDEAGKLKTDSYKDAAAEAVYKSVLEAFRIYMPER